MSAKELQTLLRDLADPAIAEHSQRFFKTGKGEYGEGDRFLGIRVPVLRRTAKEWSHLPLASVRSVLKSPFHEARLCALLILVRRFESGDESTRAEVYRLYLDHTRYINNWDLVDCSAHKIVGAWLLNRSRRPLTKLARSRDLWQRRIAIIATGWFIRHGDLDDTFRLAALLLNDPEDLMHKATGWMLREAGKRDVQRLKSFLRTHYPHMPRTMLRYAIEKFPPAGRQRYLRGDF